MESSTASGFVSRRPVPNEFNQQKLPSLQPKLTTYDLIPSFFIFGVLFFVVGGIVYSDSAEVKEYSILYDGTSTDYSNCSITISNEGSSCDVTFSFDEDITGPLYLFYELDGFYQNHLRYISSISPDQLLGENLDYDDVYTDCYPVVGNGSTVLNPCGLMANTFFNDIFTVSDSSISDLTLDSSSLTWLSDDQVRFKQVDGFVYSEVTNTSMTCGEVLGSSEYESCNTYITNDTVYYYWYPDDDSVQYLYESYSDIVNPIEGVTNQHFMVWMRAAGLPEFRKLYGVFDTDVAAGDYITFSITNNFEVVTFGGTKSLVLSTLNNVGSENYDLSYCFFVAAVVHIIFGAVMTWKRLVSPRRLGDIRALLSVE